MQINQKINTVKSIYKKNNHSLDQFGENKFQNKDENHISTNQKKENFEQQSFQKIKPIQNVSLRKRKHSLVLGISFFKSYAQNLENNYQKLDLQKKQQYVIKKPKSRVRRDHGNTIQVQSYKKTKQHKNRLSKSQMQSTVDTCDDSKSKSVRAISNKQKLIQNHSRLNSKQKDKQLKNQFQVAQHYNSFQKYLRQKPSLTKFNDKSMNALYQKYLDWKHNKKTRGQYFQSIEQKPQIQISSPKIISFRQKMRRNYIKRRNSINVIKCLQDQFSNQIGKLLYH